MTTLNLEGRGTEKTLKNHFGMIAGRRWGWCVCWYYYALKGSRVETLLPEIDLRVFLN